MVGSALASVGVQAVVGSLKAFKSGMGQMNTMLDKFGKKGSMIAKIFSPVNKILGTFFESLRRIGEFVVAGLILKGIERIGNLIRGWAEALISAAGGFQDLTVRLQGLIALDIFKEGAADSFSAALGMAGEKAEELFRWFQQLAVTTPVNTTDIANVFTLAKSYGFATEKAKEVTKAIVDFTSGMGLSDLQMRRIIENFGQMIQQGKITGTELRDLARGALVPVNDVLTLMQENLGKTDMSLEDFREEVGDGTIDVQHFIDAFLQLSGERFAGAGERANKTLRGIVNTVKELTIEMVGLNIIKPVLDSLTTKASEFLVALTYGDRFERLADAMQEIGGSFADILGLFTGDLPSGEEFAERVVGWFEDMAIAVDKIRIIIEGLQSGEFAATPGQAVSAILQVLGISEETAGLLGTFVDDLLNFKTRFLEIVEVFKTEGLLAGLLEAGVPTSFLNFLANLMEAWDNIKIFWDENGEEVKRILGEVMGGILEAIGVSDYSPDNISLIEAIGLLILGLSEKLVENAPDIVQDLRDIGDTITEDFLPAFYDVTDWIIANQDLVFEFMDKFILGLVTLRLTALATGPIMMAFGAGFIIAVGYLAEGIGRIIGKLRSFRVDALRALGVNPKSMSETGGLSYSTGAWKNLGKDIMIGWGDGLVIGFLNSIAVILPWFRWFIDYVKWIFLSQSPSKVFMDIGENLMIGFGMGIEKAMNLPETAMKTAIKHVIEPAISPLMNAGTTNNTNTQNFNLNVNTQAKAEPIIADFRMMESLAGGG